MSEPSRHDAEAPARRDEHEGEGATRGTARMEAFADGVFAIAFTLPIVGVAIPAIGQQDDGLFHNIAELLPSFAGYALASLVIGVYWVHHHFSGAIYRTTGHWFLLATVLFLTLIGFIAYPARVVAEHFHDVSTRPAAIQFWVLALAATSCGWLFKWTVGYTRGQVDPRLERDYVQRLIAPIGRCDGQSGGPAVAGVSPGRPGFSWPPSEPGILGAVWRPRPAYRQCADCEGKAEQ